MTREYLYHFDQTVQTGTMNDFYAYAETSAYHADLRITLSLIHQGKREEAFAYLQDKGRGVFCNGGIWINEAMREYCNDIKESV